MCQSLNARIRELCEVTKTVNKGLVKLFFGGLDILKYGRIIGLLKGVCMRIAHWTNCETDGLIQ